MILFSSFLLLSTLQELYEEGKYFAVIEQAEETLKDTNLNVEDEVGIRTVLAFCYVALEKDRLAKLEFLEALTLKPELELDPIFTSPKIIKVFQEAKASFKLLKHSVIPETDQTSLGIKGVKKNWQTFIIPGSWDIRNDRKTRGYLLLGSSSMSIISLGVSHYLCEKYYQEYKDAKTLDEINTKYWTCGLWSDIKIYSAVTLILSYLSNFLIVYY